MQSLDVTSSEAITEAWELATWALGRLMGTVHAQDTAQLTNILSRWACSDDLFSRMATEHLTVILSHIANIVSALKGSLAARKKSPVITSEVLKQNAAKTEDAEKGNKNMPMSSSVSSSVRPTMKKSVSTGFLASLGGEAAISSSTSGPDSVADKALSIPNKQMKFAKLQPFRKEFVLADNVRDKVKRL